MKIVYFILIGIIAGIAFAVIDTIAGNAEISPINPGESDLLKNLSVLKVVIYSTIGGIIGIAFYAVVKLAFTKRR